MYKLRIIKTILLGITIMTMHTVSADELRPSQEKSLNSVSAKIIETQVMLDEGTDFENPNQLRARDRALAKAQKSLARMEKSLLRLPNHPEVAKGLIQIENLNGKVLRQSDEIRHLQERLQAKQANEKQALRQMLVSDQTQTDTNRMKELARLFLQLDALMADSDGRLTHFVYKSINQQPVNEAIELVVKAEELIEEADLLYSKYVEFITKSGTGSLSFNLNDMFRAKLKYLASKPKFIDLFPAVQIQAVDVLKGNLDQIMKTNYNRDMFDESSSNKTSIQLDKARVIVQAKVFEAMVGGEAAEVLSMRDQIMNYWEKVKTETDINVYLKSKEEHHNKSWLTDDSNENKK